MKTIDLSWEEYKKVKRMNASTLVYGVKSMRRMKRVIEQGDEQESIALGIGVATHTLLLEPNKFEETYAVIPAYHLDNANVTNDGKPSTSTSTTYCKNKVAEFKAANEGKTFLDRHQYDTALTCIEALNSRKHLVELVASCGKEKTLYGEIDGVLFKGRVDLINESIVADLKTTYDVSQFSRTFFSLDYAFKLSIYRELARQNGYDCEVKVIAQETKDDFDNALFVVPSELLDTAMSNVMLVIAQYKQAMETGVWPGWDRGEKEVALEIPRWAQKQMEALDWSNVELSEDVEEESYY